MTTTLDDVAALAAAVWDADGLEDRNTRRVIRNDAIRAVSAPFPQIAEAAGLSTAQVGLIIRTADTPPTPTIDPRLRDIAPAKQRLLDTANRLFYANGIRTVGVDQLVEESGITKATFYKHTGGRDGLEEAYVHIRRRRGMEYLIDAAADADSAAAAITATAHAIAVTITQAGYRGDALLLAATEYPDPQHPIRRIIGEHLDWERRWYTFLFSKTQVPDAGEAADRFHLLVAGAGTAAALEHPQHVASLLRRDVDDLLRNPPVADQ